MKKYKELTFTDDFMFCKILTENPEICRLLAETITGRPIKQIGSVDVQRPIKKLKNGKGVRFDVYFEGDNDVYDFEMQTTTPENLPKRTRYYQSMLDCRSLKEGEDYLSLPRTYIVFLCTKDPFDRGLYQYTFSNVCHEDDNLPLGDDIFKIFINASGTSGNASEGVKGLCNYLIDKTNLNTVLSRSINSALHNALADEEGLGDYMTLLEHYTIERNEGRAEGRAEGIAEGRAEGRAEGLTVGRAEGKAEERLHMLSMALDQLSRFAVSQIFDATSEEIDAAEKFKKSRDKNPEG